MTTELELKMTTESRAAPDNSEIRALTIDEIENVSGGYFFWWVNFITAPLMLPAR